MDIKEIASEYYEEMSELLHDLCVIPAPSGMEDKRAEYCLDYLKKTGIENAYIDDAKNVICVLGDKTDDIALFMAHTDTVFPDLEPFEYIDDGEKIHCPGVGDDTVAVVEMLTAIKYIVKNNIHFDKTVMFACNSCEEGLGNLKGCRQIFKDHGDKIKTMYTFDRSYERVANRSVGSHRYKVTAKTEGGHSYNRFGNRNAINVLAGIITDIYKTDVPKNGNSKTTYNVGEIHGGTSVNTIAQEASMLVEYRSDDVKCLAEMEKRFSDIFDAHRKNCDELIVEKVGERPCMNGVDMEKLGELSEYVRSVQAKYSGLDVEFKSSSTDCNIPHSMGITAICVGAYEGGGAHTREEWLKKESLKPGFCIVLELILNEGNALGYISK